ncbi:MULTISPECIES: GTP 3',8-cyclase MoaA [unclassified Neisseria]|uniref:GTP 3',8-cyclase MoaA n=1 Tax=unclassified Neisseria TaxID=2623750 RepID=UPI002664F79C|nr:MULTISPECIES: GTP 3',8-cyclase MoaA [unclassified Neisseria]MDO1510125.1 GTP 3',8-cyclase MoaA [Neisseria sp. MVDL19-042950]MDO1516701.1 GTP 3',8-cyclase MoaA [Neisseria sp. MVDL18-041461]MDO1563848.1 GTP 3',8-cyclase MoaA [Neisseria sp. MVDL20-010259]
MLTDAYGRNIDYLRISVTDRCDLRCTYCLPKGFKGFAIPQDWLTIEELGRVAAAFTRLGTKRFRLTGGEPLLRKGLADLAAAINRQPGVEDISLTTNGTQLHKHARELREAGVRRLNISLDSLRNDCVKDITGTDCLPQVLDGIRTAKEAGFERIKINMVPLKGINDADLDDMVAFCIENGFILNLIEAMPMGETGQAHAKVSLQPVLAELQQKFDLTPFEGKIGGGPARYWQSADGGFTLGLITPMSQHFCATCNRVRLSATGNIHLCLGQEDKVALRPMLRAGCSDAELEKAIRHAIMLKPEKHEFVEKPKKIIRVMALTGG